MKVWYTSPWPQTAPPTQTGSQVIVNRPTPLEDHQTERGSPLRANIDSDTSFSAGIQHILNPLLHSVSSVSGPCHDQMSPVSLDTPTSVTGLCHDVDSGFPPSHSGFIVTTSDWAPPLNNHRLTRGRQHNHLLSLKQSSRLSKYNWGAPLLINWQIISFWRYPSTQFKEQYWHARSCVYSQWWEYFLLRNKVWQIQRVHDC